ncbi:hypothetical protein MCEMSEM47_01462 [Burkholderiales bacterium]
MQKSASQNKNFKVFFIFILCFSGINPVFPALNIKGWLILLLCLSVIILRSRIISTTSNLVAYFIFVLYLITCLLSSAINDSFVPIIMAFFFVLTVLPVLQLKFREIHLVVEIASNFILLLLLGSIIGMAYYELGGSPLITLKNPDGRDNYLYLTTFSNVSNFTIRPAGFFDEPGAFSFIICFLVAIRSRLRLSSMISALMMIGGMLTQSIAHLVFMLFWFIWLIRSGNSLFDFRHILKSILLMILILSIIGIIYVTEFFDWAVLRAFMYLNEPESNPRNIHFEYIYEILSSNPNQLWFGFSSECVHRLQSCSGIGENPLTPLAYGGIAVAWPFYLFILISIVLLFIGRDGILLFGLSLLLMQRPYLLEFPYSALIALVCITWVLTIPRQQYA